MSNSQKKASMGDRAIALAQSIVTTSGVTDRRVKRAFLPTQTPAHEQELIVAAVSYLNFTGYQAVAHKPWPWQKRANGTLVDWVIKVARK